MSKKGHNLGNGQGWSKGLRKGEARKGVEKVIRKWGKGTSAGRTSGTKFKKELYPGYQPGCGGDLEESLVGAKV